MCVTPKFNFIKQLLKGGKTSKVFITCRQVIPALYITLRLDCGTNSFRLCPRVAQLVH